MLSPRGLSSLGGRDGGIDAALLLLQPRQLLGAHAGLAEEGRLRRRLVQLRRVARLAVRRDVGVGHRVGAQAALRARAQRLGHVVGDHEGFGCG